MAELIAYDRATIGGVIDRMEQKGWVKRIVSERDRRARELSLSPEGERIHATLLPIVQELQNEILGPLTEDERNAFLALASRAVRA